MYDLIVDFIGALFISVLGFFYLKNEKSLIFDRLVQKFVRNNSQLFRK